MYQAVRRAFLGVLPGTCPRFYRVRGSKTSDRSSTRKIFPETRRPADGLKPFSATLTRKVSLHDRKPRLFDCVRRDPDAAGRVVALQARERRRTSGYFFQI